MHDGLPVFRCVSGKHLKLSDQLVSANAHGPARDHVGDGDIVGVKKAMPLKTGDLLTVIARSVGVNVPPVRIGGIPRV